LGEVLVDSVLSVIVLLVLVDVGADVVVANLVRQRQRVVVDLPARRPAAPPRSVRSLLLWYRGGVLIQTGSIVAVVYACLVNLGGFGAAEPLPAGRPMLITAIVAAVLLLITVPAVVLIDRGLRHGEPEEWRYLVGMGRFAPVVSAADGRGSLPRQLHVDRALSPGVLPPGHLAVVRL
jgi:hypothetical protein